MVRRAFSWKWRRASDKKQVVTSDSGSIKSWAHSSGTPISSPLSFRKPRSNGKDQFRLKGNRTHHTVAKCLRRALPLCKEFTLLRSAVSIHFPVARRRSLGRQGLYGEGPRTGLGWRSNRPYRRQLWPRVSTAAQCPGDLVRDVESFDSPLLRLTFPTGVALPPRLGSSKCTPHSASPGECKSHANRGLS